MRSCSMCGESKTDEEFAWRLRNVERMTSCKECMRLRNRIHYQNNKAKYMARAKSHDLKMSELMRQAKDKPCADCGIKYSYWVMDFDHRGDKEFTIGNKGRSRSRQAVLDEIAKCDVVCANCHRDRTHRRRTLGSGSTSEVPILG